MEETRKDAMIASIEKVEEIEDFLSEWWTVEDLYEAAAKVSAIILNLAKRHQISDAEIEDFDSIMQQHMMMIAIFKKFEKGGEA